MQEIKNTKLSNDPPKEPLINMEKIIEQDKRERKQDFNTLINSKSYKRFNPKSNPK